MPLRSPYLQLIPQTASPEEAAAIVAALERFLRDTTAAAEPSAAEPAAWRRAALIEGVNREDPGDPTDPWINT